MQYRLVGATALVVLALVTRALAGQPAALPQATARPEPDQIEQSLFLIGDAGKPAPRGEPVLLSLRRDLTLAGARALVAFLGDNVYPDGLPAPAHAERAVMERRLDAQLDAVRGSGARVVLVPGNHDWQKGGADGWDAVMRQEQHVEARDPDAAFLPDGGCPGPAVLDVSERLRLLALDTQWWLHAHARPEHPTSTCGADSEAEVLAALRAALGEAGGRDVVVLAHHPLASGGPHGGRFTLRQHLFPLTDVKRGLWLPLPLIGSLYPAARGSGVSAQDQPSREYRHMREALAGALAERPPLAWAAGHEHVLQVIESPQWGRLLVSGAGIFGHTTSVQAVPGSLYAAARAGYMRIDFLRDGTRRLAVIEVARDGSAREGFARRLEPVARLAPPRAPAAR
jgi:hypothetical protein